MHKIIFRGLPATLVTFLLAACSPTADDPYAKIENPPLVKARLHTVTLVSDDAGMAAQVEQAGFRPIVFQTSYPASVPVEASLWDVPEPVAAKPAEFSPATAGGPDLRLLIMPLAARAPTSTAAANVSFFRNVLGTDVPAWPAKLAPSDNLRVQVWTYFIPSVIEANKRLRTAHIPVIYDPVAITTSYLGDHKTMAIRAPDGTVVQLVENSTE